MKRIVALLLSAITVGYPTVSPALSGGPLEGQVLDVETGTPIAGAFVVARWKGSIPAIAESRTVCAHVETAMSDVEGRYHIATWTQPAPIPGANVTLDAYKAAYESTSSPLGFNGRPDGTWVVYPRGHPHETLQILHDEESARAATLPNNLYMKVFHGTASQRFIYIARRVFSGMNCTDAGGSQRNLYRMEVAAYQEAKSLASTAAERNRLPILRSLAIDAWRGLSNESDEPYEQELPAEVLQDLK